MPSRGQQLGKLLNPTGDIVETSLPPKIETFSQSVSETGKIEAAALGDDVSTIEQVSDINSLSASGNSVGDQRVVGNTLYIWNGSGWFRIALINETPTWDSGGQPSGSYLLDADSPQDATIITLAASDPDGFPISYSYITGGSMDSMATISQDSSVFTITPKTVTEVEEGVELAGSITFRASDGVNILPSVSSFTLSFITAIENSRYTTLLATAVDTSDNNNITDASTNNHSITVGGDTYAGTFSPYRSGGYSMYFDGSGGDYVKSPTHADFGFSTDDFTIECWYYPVSKAQNYPRIWHFGPYWSNANALAFQDRHNSWSTTFSLVAFSGGEILNSTTTVENGNWYHLVVERSGTTITLYVNGVAEDTYNIGASQFITSSTSYVTLGNVSDGGNLNEAQAHGYIRDFRYVKGTAVYDGNFTPTTEPLTEVTNTKLFTSHLPYITDGSNNHSLTLSGDVYTKPFSPYDNLRYSAADHGGSVYFDGSNDDLTIADHSAFDLSTGNWTVEFWWNPKSVNTNEGPMTVGYGSGSTPTGLKFAWENNKLYAFSMNGSTLQTGLYHDATATSLINRWNHVAAVYNGTNTDLYLNGVASGRAQSTNFGENSSDDVRIGSVRRLSSIHYSECSISDVRIVKGTAVYSGNFTPPTGPLTTTGGTYSSTTNVNTSITASNTSLLIKGTDASVIDKSQGVNLKLLGNTTGSTTQVKFADSKSMYFDGTGDYLETSAFSEAPVFGTGDWTVEGWFYATDLSNFRTIINQFASWELTLYASQLRLVVDTDGSWNRDYVNLSPISGTLSLNTWYHFALVKNGNSVKGYTDGTEYYSNASFTSSPYSTPSKTVRIGMGQDSPYYWQGYLQDIRITKGLARYTANFTPPTASLKG